MTASDSQAYEDKRHPLDNPLHGDDVSVVLTDISKVPLHLRKSSRLPRIISVASHGNSSGKRLIRDMGEGINILRGVLRMRAWLPTNSNPITRVVGLPQLSRKLEPFSFSLVPLPSNSGPGAYSSGIASPNSLNILSKTFFRLGVAGYGCFSSSVCDLPLMLFTKSIKTDSFVFS